MLKKPLPIITYFIFSFSLFLGSSQIALAESDCSPVDLRPKLPHPRIQDESGWCYAFTVADLISYKVGFSVSAFDIATTTILGNTTELQNINNTIIKNYFLKNPEVIAQIETDRLSEPQTYSREFFLSKRGVVNIGGEERSAVLMSNIKGLCSEHDLPSDMRPYIADNLNHFRARWQQSVQENPELIQNPKEIGSLTDPYVQSQAYIFQKIVNEKCQRRVQFTQPLIPEYTSIADSLEDAYLNYSKKKFRWTLDQKKLFYEINKKLTEKKPVAIGYSIYDHFRRGSETDNGDHSALIVARRMNGKKCEYFLRNTWGQNCSVYRPQYQVKCEAKHGGIWVQKQDLTTLYSVFSLAD